MPRDQLVWWRVHWPTPLAADDAVALLRQWAADGRSPTMVLEARAAAGQVVHLLGVHGAANPIVGSIPRLVPHALAAADHPLRPPVMTVRRLRASTRHRALRVEAEPASRAILAALTGTKPGEELVLQLALGPRRIPLAVPNRLPASSTTPWWALPFVNRSGDLDTEKRTALRGKVADHGFACTIRLGVIAGSAQRRRQLLLDLLAAVRTAEAPGVKLRSRAEAPGRLDHGLRPLWWPLRLNVGEAAAMSGWPIGPGPLPGVAEPHPRRLRPVTAVTRSSRVVANVDAPGDTRSLGLNRTDALAHLHVLGPTGTGKSTLLLNLITQDIAAGHGVAVIDPKGDLVSDVLARIPPDRQADVVVLDPSDTQAPVGLNPLAGRHDQPDLAADSVLAVLHGLYRDAWGPRVQDILHAGLLTLAKHGDTSLVMLPLLLTNPGFRRSITGPLAAADPIGLGAFWAWFEALSPAETQQAIAPVMSRLRALLLRRSMRAVLGQRTPRFHVRQVITEHKILLVNLAKGRLGAEASALLGSLVVAQLWQATTGRINLPAERRRPVFVYIDEVQDYLHLPTDLADVLAQSRGLGVGLTLAHQALTQLTPTVLDAVLANARSRVCFTLSARDAATIARGTTDLEPADFTALGAYQVYASLLAGGHSTPYASGRTRPPAAPTSDPAALQARSRAGYGQPLDDIEADFAALLSQQNVSDGPTGRRPRRQP
jgi:hypothetical protein